MILSPHFLSNNQISDAVKERVNDAQGRMREKKGKPDGVMQWTGIMQKEQKMDLMFNLFEEAGQHQISHFSLVRSILNSKHRYS